jgi:hypothetical protein
MSAAAKLPNVVTERTALGHARAAFTDLERWILSPKTLALSLNDVEQEQVTGVN